MDSYIKLADDTVIEFNLSNTPVSNFCQITSLTVNNQSVNTINIRELVFGASYNSVTIIPPNFASWGSNLDYTKLDLSGFKNVKTIHDNFFYAGLGAVDLDLSWTGNITVINNNFFAYNSSIKSINIGDVNWTRAFPFPIIILDELFKGITNTSSKFLYAKTQSLANSFKTRLHDNINNWTVKIGSPFVTFNYTGTITNINPHSSWILFNDNEIMPQNKNEIYLDNLNLINYTKSELSDIEGEYNNSIDSNYSENKGSVSSLLLDSNKISIKLLSDIHDFNTLTEVVSEIFMNYKNNLRLKLGVLPNKIIPCSLSNIEPELHSSYSYLTFEFEKTQRTPYNHHTIKNITNNYFKVDNYQREPTVIIITGSGTNCNISIKDNDGTQSMTINHSFNNEIIIDSKVNKVYVDKSEIDLNNLTYDSEFFELRGKCTATLNNGSLSKVII